jgi:hypothetical protein
MNYNNQLRRFMDEGGQRLRVPVFRRHPYGMREIDMMEGVRVVDPKYILDAVITAWKERALVLNTWTM